MKTLVKNVDGFDIYFEALEETQILQSDMYEPEDLEKLENSLESGELVMFCAKVTACKAGIELAEDYLGSCIYESEKDFYTKYENDYFADMVNTVLKEAKEVLPELIKDLQA